MNKKQRREIQTCNAYLMYGQIGIVARMVSALIRSAMTDRSKSALFNYAKQNKLTTHPDFIV
jgi:hypothetical protein